MLGILAVAAVAASAQLTSVPLWQGISSGLTMDEVRRLAPSATPKMDRPDFLIFDTRVRAGLVSDAWSMNGIKVRTTFYFADGRLAAMVVSFPEPKERPWSPSTLKAVAADITRDYGPADQDRVTPVPNCAVASGRWVRKPTTVTMSGMRCSTRRLEAGNLSVAFIPTTLFRRHIEENNGTPLPPDAYRPN